MSKFIKMTRHLSCVLCALFLFLSLASGNTFSFQEGSQNARNDAHNLSSKANIKLIKLENDTEKKLSGAVFSLYKTDGSPVFENLVTDENGEITVALAAGDYYFEEKTPPKGYDFMRDEENAPIIRHTFTVTKAQEQRGKTIELTVENRKAKVGTLTITKTLKNSDGSGLTEAQTKKEFNFTVTFSKGGSHYYTVENKSGKEVRHGTLKSGHRIRLCHGESAKFYSVSAENNWYFVTEEKIDGYTAATDGDAGWITESGSGAVFINTYTVPTPPGPTPEDPDNPDTPDEPEEPDNPDNPDNPDEPNNPDTPDTHDTPDGNVVPKTDDSRRPVLWLSLIFISTAGLSCCGLYVKKHLRRRKRRTNEQKTR